MLEEILFAFVHGPMMLEEILFADQLYWALVLFANCVYKISQPFISPLGTLPSGLSLLP